MSADELRVGLTLRECRAWVEALRNPPRGVRLRHHIARVAAELEGAVNAAHRAGITNGRAAVFEEAGRRG